MKVEPFNHNLSSHSSLHDHTRPRRRSGLVTVTNDQTPFSTCEPLSEGICVMLMNGLVEITSESRSSDRSNVIHIISARINGAFFCFLEHELHNRAETELLSATLTNRLGGAFSCASIHVKDH